MTAYVLRAILAGTLVAAAPLGAQATGRAARDSAIRAAALRDTPEASDMRAGIYSVAGDTAVVVVWQPIPLRDTTFGEVLAYSVTVLRRGGEWVRVGPRRPVAGSFGKPKYAPVKLAPPKPGNRISTP